MNAPWGPIIPNLAMGLVHFGIPGSFQHEINTLTIQHQDAKNSTSGGIGSGYTVPEDAVARAASGLHRLPFRWARHWLINATTSPTHGSRFAGSPELRPGPQQPRNHWPPVVASQSNSQSTGILRRLGGTRIFLCRLDSTCGVGQVHGKPLNPSATGATFSFPFCFLVKSWGFNRNLALVPQVLCLFQVKPQASPSVHRVRLRFLACIYGKRPTPLSEPAYILLRLSNPEAPVLDQTLVPVFDPCPLTVFLVHSRAQSHGSNPPKVSNRALSENHLGLNTPAASLQLGSVIF
ncbi:hypothetical protein MAC_07238 [Metarhizium acridum CQMa 102]|uniref:Uncharacterized protein n=1 Tax=Metarhizium acridum (strain CQMa 102) TaxID=655827 RepID=E9EBJ0_METAQ|nr:uncharacterized protein MAC_07238 [Metarhizium acridum CQMa 102]EFY86737.1 hypothetical protein MAC_07238 [Metarhizium acridum CQMa 102]